METVGKISKKILDIKTSVTKMKDALEGLFNKLGKARKQ